MRHRFFSARSARPSSAVWCIALALLGAAEGQAEPRYLRVSIVGDPSTTMTLSWNIPPGASGAAVVHYGRAPEQLQHARRGTVGPLLRPPLGRVAEVELTGLLPATRYFYRVGEPGSGQSRVYSFRTAPTWGQRCPRYRFAYLGDSRAERYEPQHGASAKWPLLALRALGERPDFILHGGDIVFDGRKAHQWDHMLRVTTPVSSVVPIMYSLGNHDRDATPGDDALFNRLFAYPRAQRALGGSGTEDFYYFRYGNGLFVALSTDSFTGPRQRPFGQQAQWLDRVLAGQRARWNVVYLHRPIYTQGPVFAHPPDEVGQNRALVAAINKHRVELVIGSHNHFYERFAPSRCADSASRQPCSVATGEGTVYLTSGGGGAFPIFWPGRTNRDRLSVSGRHHFLLFDIEGERLSMRVIDERGTTLDRLALGRAPGCADGAGSGVDGK